MASSWKSLFSVCCFVLLFFLGGGKSFFLGGEGAWGKSASGTKEDHLLRKSLFYHVCTKVCRGSNFRVHRTLMILDVVSPFLSA